MARADLLALSPDDLAALTNRGTVKRAQRELADDQLTCEIDESAELLVITWSDEVHCTFHAGKTIHDATCSSGSLGISRHIVRSVLQYQEHHRSASKTAQTHTSADSAEPADDSAESAEQASTEGASWDPGEITDAELTRVFRKATVTRARKVFQHGVLVELVRGPKPVARFLHESCTVRFPVPGDLRYATADCAESQLAQWVSLAVWAFREFDSDRLAGLLSLQQAELPVPTTELQTLDKLLSELCADGVAAVPATWPQRAARVEKKLRAEGLVWLAELLLETLHHFERYQDQDARFDPLEVAHFVGELIARSRAIQAENQPVPQLLIRGTKSDRRTDIKSGRFVGIGLGVRAGRQNATLSAFLQDADTGTVVTVERTFSDPEPDTEDEPKSFTELAQHSLTRGVSLGNASLSQLLLGSGKRTPTGELILPRGSGKLTTNPQTYQWEQLKPPLAVTSFEQLRQRFEALPPSWLRPLRRTENLHVVTVAGVVDTQFDVVGQQLIATLQDPEGHQAKLIHPFHSRGLDGFNDLNEVLQTRGKHLRFVCGHVRMISGEIQIFPVSIVVEQKNGRIALNPWLANKNALPKRKKSAPPTQDATPQPIPEFFRDLRDDIADALLTGLRQTNPHQWANHLEVSRQLGFVRLAATIKQLADELATRSSQLRWDAQAATKALRQLCLIARILE